MSYSEVKTTINSTLGNENFQPLDQIVVDNIQQVLNKLDTSSSSGNQVVKSVQRGVQEQLSSYSADDYNYYFSLNTVNPNKCMVNINSMHYEAYSRTQDSSNYSAFSLQRGHALISLSANKLQISCTKIASSDDNHYIPAFSWEVIEFY